MPREDFYTNTPEDAAKYQRYHFREERDTNGFDNDDYEPAPISCEDCEKEECENCKFNTL